MAGIIVSVRFKRWGLKLVLSLYYRYLSDGEVSEDNGKEEERCYEGEDADLVPDDHGEVCVYSSVLWRHQVGLRYFKKGTKSWRCASEGMGAQISLYRH